MYLKILGRSTADLISSVFLIISFIGFLVLIFKKNDKNLPPSPRALPIIGNLHQLGLLPHRSLAALSNTYGPIFRLRLGSVPAIYISSAELAEEVLKTQDAIFGSRPRSSIAENLAYGQRDIAFASNGPRWRYLKKACVTHLLNFKRVQSFQAVREEEMILLLSNIRSASSKPINLSHMLATFSFDVVCRVALGKKYSTEYSGFYEMVCENMALLGSFPFKDYIPILGWLDELSGLNARVRRTFNQIDRLLEQILNDHINNGTKYDKYTDLDAPNSMDFMDVLLWLKNNDADGNINIERDTLKAVVWDMFVGATDTTTSTLEWAMTHLFINPSSMKKAQEEIRRVTRSKKLITEEMICQMEYLSAIIKETIRLHPPVPLLFRKAQEDSNLQGYTIPAGTNVFINSWKISRDPKYWNNPDVFFPERFLDNNINFKGQHFQFLPFGAGRRSCPGITFGSIVLHLILSNLLCYFNWEVFDEKKADVLSMTELTGVTVRKKFGLHVIAKQYKED